MASENTVIEKTTNTNFIQKWGYKKSLSIVPKNVKKYDQKYDKIQWFKKFKNNELYNIVLFIIPQAFKIYHIYYCNQKTLHKTYNSNPLLIKTIPKLLKPIRFFITIYLNR